MGVASVSEYVASLNEEQQRHICAFIEFMNAEYPQLTNKISFSMPMWLVGKKMNEGYVAVSAAKNHFSIHFSDEEFLNRLAVSLPTCKKASDASTSNMAMCSPFTQSKTVSAIF